MAGHILIVEDEDHIARLLELELRQLVQTIRGVGYCIRGEPE